MTYQEFKDKKRVIINNMPWFFVLTTQQLEEEIKKLGLRREDVVCVFDGYFCARECYDEVKRSLDQIHELNEQFKRGPSKELYKALMHEFWNYECCVSEEPYEAIEAVGIELTDRNKAIINKAWKAFCYKNRMFYTPVYELDENE